MSKFKNLSARVDTEDYEDFQAEADRLGITLSQLVRARAFGTEGEKISNACRGRFTAPQIAYLIEVGEAIAGGPEWANRQTGVVIWLESLYELRKWLWDHPYDSEAPERVEKVFGNLPQDMREFMVLDVRKLQELATK